MLDSFLTFINQHTPALKEQPALLAVSGGIDSVVMAHMFHHAGIAAGIAHCNFGLRGAESDADEAFVKALAEAYHFPFFTKKFDVKVLSASESISTQMAARELRYQWFEEVRRANGYHWIATAHHANDSLETLILNLARGTGLAGLHGIAPVNERVIRPLILASRAQIEQYARENQLAWREDRSNQTDDYSRNKVRHHVIPVLQALNPSLEQTFTTTAEKLTAADRLLSEMLGNWCDGIVSNQHDEVRITYGPLLTESEPAYRLWHILHAYGFSYSQTRNILRSLSGIPGKTFYSATHTLLVDRTDLIIRKIDSRTATPDTVVTNSDHEFTWGSLEFTMRQADLAEPLDYDSYTIAVDAGKLAFPLTLRKWRRGDVFSPFGMKGRRKKVSDLLIDRKLNLNEKDAVCVLVNGDGEIIWVVGIRAAEGFRLSGDSKSALVIRVRNNL